MLENKTFLKIVVGHLGSVTSLSTSKSFLGNPVEGLRVLNTGVCKTFLGNRVKGVDSQKNFLKTVFRVEGLEHRGGRNFFGNRV